MREYCKDCQKPLHPDEEGLSIKLLGHNICDYFCIECLGRRVGASPETLRAMIERYRDAGCQLFSPKEN